MLGAVGVGVIGVGFMGRTHIASFARTAGCALRAVHDPAQKAAVAGNLATTGDDAERLVASLPRAASVDDLLARPDIDLVSVCTPTDTHVDLVRAAIRAGKHVLVEKPTALDAAAIDALDDEARAAGVLVMPAHCMRFWPAWAWMAEAVHARRYGAVRHASFRRLGAAPAWSQSFYLDFARSGGAVVDLHIHDADFVRFAFGEPVEVKATGTRRHVVARYAFADGARVEAEGGWMEDPAFAFTMVATIECERAVIDFRLGREHELVVVEDGVQRALVAGADYPTGNGYDHEIAALVQAIMRGAARAPVTLSDAAATQRLLDREIAQLS
ncbi:MAG: Gfo/Idh/MocA family protein [Planctomycetota bacterium]